jgi:hypothetical protein
MNTYEQEVKDQIEYLDYTLKNLPGVTQGFLVKNEFGDVINRIGRISMNPPWYREFYRLNGRRPYKKELETLARHQLDNGFYDSYGFIPPFHKR